MRPDLDLKDQRIRREAFKAIADFAKAVTEMYDQAAADSYGLSADDVVTSAQAAVMYLADDLREPIDHALGLVELRGELIEEVPRLTESRITEVAAFAILRATLGIPPPKVWPVCAEPGCPKQDRDVAFTRAGYAGPTCYAHSDYVQNRMTAPKATEERPL